LRFTIPPRIVRWRPDLVRRPDLTDILDQRRGDYCIG